MLTSSTIFSTLRPAVVPANLPNKDINIFEHTLEPVPKLNISCKKSSTNPNCLAVSATHIFAAQADKAVVQVYSREKGIKVVDVPFGERIVSCCFVESRIRDGVGILVLGMEGGRLILWEICTGRQISTPPAHLEAVTCLAVDSTGNFLLSGSKDHNIHVWKLANLLSFTTESRIQHETFSEHRGAINSLCLSHSRLSNAFALSAAEDKTVILWNFRNTTRLMTFLTSSVPRCLALDPADRAFYIATEDSVQFVNLQGNSLGRSTEAVELGESHKWTSEPPILCLDVNSDGTQLLTGHENGKVFKRTTPRGQSMLVYDAHLPVSNVVALIPTGFPNEVLPASKPSIVKPRLEMTARKEDGLIPDRYEFNASFTSTLALEQNKDDLSSEFDQILEHPSFPDELIHAPLTTATDSKGQQSNESSIELVERMQEENRILSANANNLKLELDRREQLEIARQRRKKLNRIRKAKELEIMRRRAMGEENGDMDIDEGNHRLEPVSSDTED